MKDFETKSGRFTAEQSRHLNYVIADMVNRGIKTGQISRTLRVRYGTVADRIHKMRRDGVISAFESLDSYRAALFMAKRKDSAVGTMETLFKTLESKTARWVIENTPKGSSAAEFIAAIVRDAYFDETGGSDEGSA